ncbi:17786_t:CDS:1, partial [Funneliformis caledonium]
MGIHKPMFIYEFIITGLYIRLLASYDLSHLMFKGGISKTTIAFSGLYSMVV